MKVNKAPLYITALVVLSLLILQLIHTIIGPKYILNLSSSLPIGIYRITPFDGRLRRGKIAWIKTPESAGRFIYDRGWLPHGWPLLKHIEAIPGDTFSITSSTFSVNNKYIGPVFNQDSKGKPLPKLRGNFRVQAGHFLPVATNIEKSFDGRYFGAIPQTYIIAIAVPILIYKEHS